MSDPGCEILLVEDNPHDVELMLHALKVHRLPQRVTVARDGAEALERVFGRNGRWPTGPPPDLVLLDLKLPRVDGLEVLQRLKADSRTRAIPVVVLTSSRDDRDVIQCYQLGANSYIVKPVDFNLFTEAVHTLGSYWLELNRTPAPVHPTP